MHRVLKPAGSIFLHYGRHADAYITVEILDKIFGRNNFRNEIIWCYSKGGLREKLFSVCTIIFFFMANSFFEVL